MNQNQQLKKAGTVIVADTGEIKDIIKHKPTDATTNPSLIYKAAQMPEYSHLVKDAIEYGLKSSKKQSDQLDNAMDRLAVNFGAEIAKVVPGVVSTEVDARLSFKTERTVEKARKLIKMYADKGVPSDRILIKIASTWQGIKAGEILEKEGIHVNMTLLFSHEAQAVACAEAGVTLISPFVGRITDWYKKEQKVDGFEPEKDPGVLSVRKIYKYYKEHGYKTIVMGASFRTKGQILALAGCDKLTIGPKFLEEMEKSTDPVPVKLAPGPVTNKKRPELLDDRHFYMRMCRDAMAIDKLHEGIRLFVADTEALEKVLKSKMFPAPAKAKL